MKSISLMKAIMLMFGLALFATTPAMAQPQTKQEMKANRKYDNQVKKELSAKALKQARKEAKRYKKGGYYVPPGKLPMDKQLEKAYMRQWEEDEMGYPRYIVGNAVSIGGTKIAAKNQAIEAAKLELAGQVETTIVGLVENSFANNQITQEEATSLTKTVTGSKNIISQKLGRVIVLFEAYKDMGKNAEVAVMIAYNQELAMEVAKQSMREELEDEADEIHKKLDQILDF